MEQATVETDFISTLITKMDWVEGGRLIANPPWSDDTASEFMVMPRWDCGQRAWLASAVDEKLQVLSEIREQHVQRQAKRLGVGGQDVKRSTRNSGAVDAMAQAIHRQPELASPLTTQQNWSRLCWLNWALKCRRVWARRVW
jgi:hypothetical protein